MSEQRQIPKAAQEDLHTAYKEMQTKWEAFQEAKYGFTNLIQIVRTALSIPSNELWDLDDEITTFTKVNQMPKLTLVDDAPEEVEQEEEVIVLTPETEDGTKSE